MLFIQHLTSTFGATYSSDLLSDVALQVEHESINFVVITKEVAIQGGSSYRDYIFESPPKVRPNVSGEIYLC